jgi:transcriptional regulator with XRE-family HTH domain
MSNFDPTRLTEIRKSKGMTQRELARAAGVSQALVAELERGKHPPSISSLAKLAVALSVHQNDFDGR